MIYRGPFGEQIINNLALRGFANKITNVYKLTPDIIKKEHESEKDIWSKIWEEPKKYIPKNCEITVEINPDDATPSLICFLKKIGVNRVSLGVQSLVDQELKYIKRTHTKKTSKDAILALYDAGIKNISIDIMYDIPNQTIKSFENTLKEIKDCPIKHISLYNMTIEPHTYFYRNRVQYHLF